MFPLLKEDLTAIQKGEYTADGLEWGGYEFEGTAMEETVKILLTCPHNITRLNLHETNLTLHDIEQLTALDFLEELNLDCIPIGDKGLVLLSKMKNLKKLSIGGCEITTAGFKKFLETHQGIQEIDASENAIGEEALKPLMSHQAIKILSLQYASRYNNEAKIGDKGAYYIAQNTSLEELNLKSNCTGAGALELAKHPRIKKLFLDSNAIKDEHLVAFEKNQVLEEISLEHNLITKKGAAILFKMSSLLNVHLDATEMYTAPPEMLDNGFKRIPGSKFVRTAEYLKSKASLTREQEELLIPPSAVLPQFEKSCTEGKAGEGQASLKRESSDLSTSAAKLIKTQ